MIDRFTGEFRFLSNFYPSIISIPGEVFPYPTVEHAYQALKSEDSHYRTRIRNVKSPNDAKRFGRKAPLRPNWDGMKLRIMEELVRCKFQQHPALRQLLLATKDIELVEGNTWNDTFWGVCHGIGANHLGRILMKIRAELR